ncbi:hypothetical protein EDD96_5189 [Streptomyces sp. Ag109_G2-6]|uniref:hypothetical protein n=1 Tax=Streptomyces sp. Ag109_G2-6 TaxID=2485154 RepID=UPI000F516932|nr:hypothetical protein [Streptomyces sp. Ag109_G2-6]RPF41390.1 hypothetical protein EDD96_5189 [Streptomyces sp. Ag109_G2-6]
MRDDHKNPPGPATPTAGDEQVLRSLFAGAVQGLEPSEGALERLRHAVPARRARKRQTLVGAAVAVLLAGTGIPAALHLGEEDEGSAAGHSAMAGHGEAPGGLPGDPHHDGPEGGTRPQPTRPADRGQTPGGTGGRPSPRPGGSPSGGVSAGPSGDGLPTAPLGNGPQPPAGAAAAAPECTADQLGVAGSARAPESDGKVYGSFKVTNVSPRGCTVTGPDTVTAASLTQGPPPAQPRGVTVTGHTAGDPASGLPDPAEEAPALVLQPKQAYEVLFAWVPSAHSCPAGTPGPTTTPERQNGTAQRPAGQSDGGPADTAAGGAAGVPAGAGDPAGGVQRPADPDTAGVAVSHAPATATGAPVTQTTIPQACGGTVYRTGLIPQPTS